MNCILLQSILQFVSLLWNLVLRTSSQGISNSYGYAFHLTIVTRLTFGVVCFDYTTEFYVM